MISEQSHPIATQVHGPVAVYETKVLGLGRPARLFLSSSSRYGIHIWVLLLAVVIMANTQGCATIPKRNPVPETQSQIAQIPGIPMARVWGDEIPPDLDKRLALLKAQMQANNPEALYQPHNYLAISGGGSNGAFGAGLLVGWTEAGGRPEFFFVTGISTGALIAPFAFLGPAYDMQLEDVYTTVSTEELIKVRRPLQIITGDAAAGTEPMKELLARYYTQQMLADIATEHEKGRRLFVGTTNLDAERPVVWNIGAIAVSGDPKALELVHKVLLASASIPAAFPPVYIEVEANGQRYDEIHVDGGTATQVFLFPGSVDWRGAAENVEVKGKLRVYVIRNAFLEPQWKAVNPPKLLPIAMRSISSLIRAQGIGDLYRIYLRAQRAGIDYNLAYMPATFTEKPKEQFDPEYMQKLFDLGYGLAKNGYPWEKVPPGIEPP
ncbi:MAG: patatin-like phospholipase family protein [Deltaproteobacteria bacterium]|nr:MAG: patatin-like phospholipase family protein [Deltaproteobacteria bacterium]